MCARVHGSLVPIKFPSSPVSGAVIRALGNRRDDAGIIGALPIVSSCAERIRKLRSRSGALRRKGNCGAGHTRHSIGFGVKAYLNGLPPMILAIDLGDGSAIEDVQVTHHPICGISGQPDWQAGDKSIVMGKVRLFGSVLNIVMSAKVPDICMASKEWITAPSP